MLPVLIQLGDQLKIHTYGVMIALGVMVALNLAQRYARQQKLDDRLIGDLGFWMLLTGLAGARVLYILIPDNFAIYAANPLKVFKIWEGGLVFYGGF